MSELSILSDAGLLPLTKWPFDGTDSAADFFRLGMGEAGSSSSGEASISRALMGLSSIVVVLMTPSARSSTTKMLGALTTLEHLI